jgi:hypothetical protein
MGCKITLVTYKLYKQICPKKSHNSPQQQMKLEFNAQQLQILSAALVELPYKMSAPLINHINQQIKEQQALEIDSREDMVAAGS